MKKNTVILALLMVCSGAFAQTTNVSHPDLQRSDAEIYDPTRENKVIEAYQFRVDYRIEAGYVQQNHRSLRSNYPDGYLHGAKLGVTFDFVLPRHFTIQTGLDYCLTYGTKNQHWGQIDAADIYGHSNFIRHRLYEHQLCVPVRAYYIIPLIKEFRMFFYGGPQLLIGLSLYDKMDNQLSPMTNDWAQANGIATQPYDLYTNELWRANIQMGVGGGFEWDKYRLEAGYDFGLNNLVRKKVCSNQQMWEWGWSVKFAYKF